MPRWLIITGSAIAFLLAGAWAWSFATKTGVLFSASDYMVSDLHNVEPDPTATDEPVGKLCDYVSYNGVHSLILLDQNQADLVQIDLIQDGHPRPSRRYDPRLDGDVEMVDGWYSARCPATRVAAH